MRRALSQLFNVVPADVFSFVAGAVFSAAINLATAKIDVTRSFRLPPALLGVSTIGFIVLGFLLKAARESAADRPNPRDAYFNNIYTKIPILCFAFLISMAVLILAVWQVAR